MAVVARSAGPSDTSSRQSRDSSSGLPNLPDSPAALTIGDCVSDTDFGNRDPKPMDCSNPRSIMELVSQGGANAHCPDGKTHEDTDYTTLFWADTTMCFAANFIEDNCYAVNTSDPDEPPFTHEDCGTSGAMVKVVQRFDGTTDETRCPPGAKPITYQVPARLYCLEPAR